MSIEQGPGCPEVAGQEQGGSSWERCRAEQVPGTIPVKLHLPFIPVQTWLSVLPSECQFPNAIRTNPFSDYVNQSRVCCLQLKMLVRTLSLTKGHTVVSR